jgi:hypothetical protein
LAESDGPQRSSREDGRTPIPDPTVLTTKALEQAIASLKELFFARLELMDRAVRELYDAKFKGIEDRLMERDLKFETQFQERDVRQTQANATSKIQVETALSAAKELQAQQEACNALAIGKSEVSVEKRMEQITGLINTFHGTLTDKIDANNSTLSEKIEANKDQLNRLVALGMGRKEEHVEQQSMSRDVWGVVAVVVAIAAVAVAIIVPLILRGA